MKNVLKILSPLLFLLLIGCSQSVIKLIVQEDKNPHMMFGKNPNREFYEPVFVSDSLKLLWENDAHGNFTNSSIVYYDSTIFVSDLSGRVHSYDLQTGKMKGALKNKGAVYSSPIVYINRLIIPLCLNDENETEIISYDFRSSRELFRKKIKGKVLTELISVGDDIIYCTDEGELKRISPAGGEIWAAKTNSQIYSDPAANEKYLLLATTRGEIIIMNLSDGKIINRKKIGNPFFGGITIKKSTAYLADDKGILYAISIPDCNIIWSYDASYRILMTPALDNENLFIGNLYGDLFSIDLSTGKLNWKKNFSGLFNSTPLITNNRIFITDLARSFLSIDKNNGEIKNKYPLDGRGKLSPVFVDNKIIIGFDDGILRAYEIIY